MGATQVRETAPKEKALMFVFKKEKANQQSLRREIA